MSCLGNFQEAQVKYVECITQLMKGLKFEKKEPAQKSIKLAAAGFMARAETLKQGLSTNPNQSKNESTPAPASVSSGSVTPTVEPEASGTRSKNNRRRLSGASVSGGVKQEAVTLIADAVKADEQKDYPHAILLYRAGLELMLQGLRETNPGLVLAALLTLIKSSTPICTFIANVNEG